MKSLRHLFPFKSYFHFLFPLPVSSRHLSFRCRPMSGRVGSVISKSGVVDNVGVAVGIASPSVSFQKLFPLPFPWPTSWVPDVGICRTMSPVSYSSRALSKMWHQPIESRRYVFQFKRICLHACLASAILRFACRSTLSRDKFYTLVGLF